MSVQAYFCPQHGEFTITQLICDPVLPTRPCSYVYGGCEERGHPVNYCHKHTLHTCGRDSDWRPSTPIVHVVDGTGAGRQLSRRRNDAREQFREEHDLER